MRDNMEYITNKPNCLCSNEQRINKMLIKNHTKMAK